LDGFLSRYDGTDVSHSGTGGTSASALAAPLVDADRYQLSVGKLLLSLHRQDRSEFDRELESARNQVVHMLSA
jgi:hypothetical protein